MKRRITSMVKAMREDAGMSVDKAAAVLKMKPDELLIMEARSAALGFYRLDKEDFRKSLDLATHLHLTGDDYSFYTLWSVGSDPMQVMAKYKDSDS